MTRPVHASTALLFALALAGLSALEPAGAETIAVGDQIEVKKPDVAAPTRGMTMDQVLAKFGAPVSKEPPVGKPPISRWEYRGFVVYFESNHVIHSVAADS